MNENKPTKVYSIAEMVEAYHLAMSEVVRAYEKLDEAEKIMGEYFGGTRWEFSTIPDGYSFYSALGKIDKVKDNYKRSAWKLFIDKLGIRRVMSPKKQDELDNNLEQRLKEFPEITIENVMGIMKQLADNALEYQIEFIKEVHRLLLPYESSIKKYKTNKKSTYEIQEKVIMIGATYYQYGWKLQYRRDREFTQIDRCFHELAGKPFASLSNYTSPLVESITSSPGYGETELFKYKCFHNGNLHLTFKRMDLVKQINAIASGESRSLKGKL